jgi:lysyl-tRNA synthetase class I
VSFALLLNLVSASSASTPDILWGFIRQYAPHANPKDNPGKKHKFDPLRDWFRALYEVLFGQEQGPRFGSFAVLYGVTNTAKMIRDGLAGRFLA